MTDKSLSQTGSRVRNRVSCRDFGMGGLVSPPHWGGPMLGLDGGNSRMIRDNFHKPTIKGKIRYKDDNIGLKQSLIVNIEVIIKL